MLTQERILEVLRAHRSDLMSEYGVRRIGIFGSYARGTQDRASDVDIVAEFDAPLGLKFMELTDYLESLLGRPADVLTPAGIQGIRDPRIAKEIQETIVYA